MTHSMPDFVGAGLRYLITAVKGRSSPGDVTDLAGWTTFTVEGSTGRHTVSGQGVLTENGSVRLTEKDNATGKDVRVWTIRKEPGQGLIAHT